MNMRRIVLGVLVLFIATVSTEAVNLSEGFSLNLYASFEFERQLSKNGLGDKNGSFDIDQIDVVFNHEKDNLKIALDIVLEHGVATESGFGNAEVSFGFLEYKISNGLRLRAGKFLSPFGIHNQLHGLKASFLAVKEPVALFKPTKFVGNAFNFFPRREAGLYAWGTLPSGAGYFQYDVVIGNGYQEEDNPYEKDNNPQKSFTGRLDYYFSPFLHAGVSTYTDKVTEGGSSFRTTSFGGQFKYDGEMWVARAEVYSGRKTPDAAGAASTSQLAGYAEAGYQITQDIIPYVQLQYLRTSKQSVNQSLQGLVIGAHFHIHKTLAFKIDNGYFKGSNNNSKFSGVPSRSYNELRAALILGL